MAESLTNQEIWFLQGHLNPSQKSTPQRPINVKYITNNIRARHVQFDTLNINKLWNNTFLFDYCNANAFKEYLSSEPQDVGSFRTAWLEKLKPIDYSYEDKYEENVERRPWTWLQRFQRFHLNQWKTTPQRSINVKCVVLIISKIK